MIPKQMLIRTSRTNELRVWFSENLDRPDRFSNSSSKGYYRRSTKGLSWFKASAKEHIRKPSNLSLFWKKTVMQLKF